MAHRIESALAEIYYLEKNRECELPLYLSRVRAGFPSPADDFVEKKLDLNEFLIKHQAATFLIKVKGDSMTDANINSGDILIIDRSLEAKNKDVVLAVIDGEFTVKRINKINDKLFLVSENCNYSPIEISSSMDFEVWGVVKHVIHSF